MEVHTFLVRFNFGKRFVTVEELLSGFDFAFHVSFFDFFLRK
jgi:hypothetical protein